MVKLFRREFLATLAAAQIAPANPAAPAGRVALARHRSYHDAVVPTLERMFDQLGGLSRLVRGKTVAIKLNLGGPSDRRLGHMTHGRTNWVNPEVIGAALHLLDRAGAQRIRLLEGSRFSADPLTDHMIGAGWEPMDFIRAASRVEIENSNVLGSGKNYHRLKVPGSGYIYHSFELNHSYVDCDFFISLAKLKEHTLAGVTLSLKNCFGITPTSIYGDDAGVAEPNEDPGAGRSHTFHNGWRQPPQCAEPEIDPSSSRSPSFRVPRIVVDIVAARPVDLAIIDGIECMGGSTATFRGNPFPVHAGVLVAGLNPVNADAVATAVMGFDPRAQRGTYPFDRADNTLELAEARGIGTRNLDRIEVTGEAIDDVKVDFRAIGRTAGKQQAFRQPQTH